MRACLKTTRRLWIVLLLLSLIAAPSALAQEARPASLLEYSWVWYELYGLHSAAIDAYNDANYMELSALSDVGIPFVAASEYEELNKAHADGRFEGTLPYSGHEAYVEQAGGMVDFGLAYARDWDGMSIAEKKGDLVTERGRLDIAAGRVTCERTVAREGAHIERDTYEYKLTPDGGVLALAAWGDLYNYQGDERNLATAVYLQITQDALVFVLASANMGPQFAQVSLGEGEMTAEEAAQAFEAAGYVVQMRGAVRDGAVVLD